MPLTAVDLDIFFGIAENRTTMDRELWYILAKNGVIASGPRLRCVITGAYSAHIEHKLNCLVLLVASQELTFKPSQLISSSRLGTDKLDLVCIDHLQQYLHINMVHAV